MINPLLMTLIIAIVAGVVIVVVIALAWLIRAHLKLKRDYQALTDVVHGHNNDIADLCAAALSADGRIGATDEQISALSEKISAYKHHEPPPPPPPSPAAIPFSLDIQKMHSGMNVNDLIQNSSLSQDEAAFHPYGLAIQKVRSGASVSELMQNSGLSQDEAALLIRLHGSKAPL